MKYTQNILAFLILFFIWIFVNGFWEMAKAPEDLTSCQKVAWAQAENKNDFRPDEWLALWILKKLKCDNELQSEVSNALDKHPMSSVYVCYWLAQDPGREADLDLIEKLITTVNHSPSSKPRENIELLNYALDEIEAMDAEKKVFVYDYACKEQVNKIRKAIEEGLIVCVTATTPSV